MAGTAWRANLLLNSTAGRAGIASEFPFVFFVIPPEAGDICAAHMAELLAMKLKESTFSFTASATALWEAFGPAIRKRDLPVSKDGRGKGKQGVVEVFTRLLVAGLLAKTEDRKTTPRY